MSLKLAQIMTGPLVCSQPWLTTCMPHGTTAFHPLFQPLLHSTPLPLDPWPAGMLMAHWNDDRSMAWSTYKVGRTALPSCHACT